MEAFAIAAVLSTIVAWCVLAGRLQPTGLTAPIVFVAAGWLLTEGIGLLDLEVEPELVRLVAEVTLVWVLFADASRVRLDQFRRDLALYARLLGVGLPLTVALGAGAAMVVLGFDPWAALLVGAALAPTDAALGAPVMANPRVPPKVRRALNVESGLNDGIVTPIVLVAVAGVAADLGIHGVESPERAVLSLLVGLVAGIVVGGVGGIVTRLARERGWLSEELAGPAVLALALLAYTAALAVSGNGFVAAFVGGLVFGNLAGPSGEKEVYFVDQSADVASMISWLVFGALAIPVMQDTWSWTVVVYAVDQPDRRPHAPRRAGAGRRRSGPVQPPLRRVVRSARPRLGDLRADRPGGPRRRRPRRRGGHVAHDPAQRGGTRPQRGAGGEPLPLGGTDRAGRGHPRLTADAEVTRPDSTAASSAAWSRSFWSA